MFRPQGFKVVAGRSYTVKITPVVHRATENYRGIDLAKRRCRYSDEPIPNHDSMFTFYSQKSCFFECTLKKAAEKVAKLIKHLHKVINYNFIRTGRVSSLGLSDSTQPGRSDCQQHLHFAYRR